jgi:hypothetical protein
VKRPSWLPQLVIPTASGLAVIGIAALFGRSRHAIAESVRWLAHPVDTPRVVFLLLLALAAAAGLMLLAALAKRLFGMRDKPVRRAEHFRSAWELLADHLRTYLNWEATNPTSSNAPSVHEQFRDDRRAAQEAYALVQDDFRRFLREHGRWDLREPDSGWFDEEGNFYEEKIEGPFEDLWLNNDLPATMRWIREMTPDGFSAWIGRRSAVLDAFVTWTSDR